LTGPKGGINLTGTMVEGINHYEEAFEAWLADNGVEYVAVDQQKRAVLKRNRVKSFDYLVYPPLRGDFFDFRRDEGADLPSVVAVELKGRRFGGSSLVSMSGLQCWVSVEDVQGLVRWEERFDRPRGGAKAAFVFAYELVLPCVETDGREVFEYDGRTYMFRAIDIEDYVANMKPRSERWRTVMLGAAAFRRHAVDLREFLFSGEPEAVYSHV